MKASKTKHFQNLRDCHVYHGGEGGCCHEGKAVQAMEELWSPREPSQEKDSQRSGAHNCEKRLLWVAQRRHRRTYLKDYFEPWGN